MGTRSFHGTVRELKRKPVTGEPVYAFGARVGWWPCLRAPFISITLGRWVVEVWHGLPSYKEIR